MIKFHCPSCGNKLGAPDDYVDKQVRCAKCRQLIRVPAQDEKALRDKHDLIKYRCPNCNQKLGVPLKYAGKRVRCTKCQEATVVPQPQPKPRPVQPAPTGGVTDDMFEEGLGTGDMFGDGAGELLAAEANAPAVEDALRLKPLTPTHQTERQVKCPTCGAPNRSDTEFCTTCAEPIGSPAKGPALGVATKIPLSLAASLAFTLAGAVAWTILAYLIGLVWVQPLCIVVAGLAGYGLVLFTDKRNAALGLLAALVGFVGIITGKVLIAKWVVLPEIENVFASAEWHEPTVTEEQVDERMKDPNAVFRAACFQMAEEGEFEEEFASKIVDTHYDGRAPLGEAEQIQAGIEQVEETLQSWSDEQKREAIRAQHTRDMEAFKDFGRALVGEMAESAEEDEEVPEGIRQVAKEADDLMSGDKALAETKIGFVMAFFGSFSCLDIIWFPLALWSAYKIGTGRE